MLKHVKQTGVSVNTDKSFHWTKSSLAKFIKDYQRLFSVNTISQETATQNTTSQNAKSKTDKVILSYEALVVNAVKG
ncbi:MAG: hypothetical protein CR966_01835 [Pseudomonadales bacterium]|nr:MAG: hypothetical protein CR966_01835 [Pseudomonadales bacterium]